MKIKDVLAALRGLDPELDCTIEILPTEQEFNRGKGAFGIPFKVEQIEGKARAVVRVSLTEIRIIEQPAAEADRSAPGVITVRPFDDAGPSNRYRACPAPARTESEGHHD